MRRGLVIAMTATMGAGALGLSACGPDHKLDRIDGPEHKFVVTVDYVSKLFGASHDAIISLQEKRGLATEVAKFKNVRELQVAWLGPEDFAICQIGAVQDAKRSVTLNTSTGNQTIYIHYNCPPQQ